MIDVQRAVLRNQYWNQRLEWGEYYDNLVEVIGNSARASEQAFAKCVASWQARTTGLEVDGIIGPKTWSEMRRRLGFVGGQRGEGRVHIYSSTDAIFQAHPALRSASFLASLYNFDVNSAQVKEGRHKQLLREIATILKDGDHFAYIVGCASATGNRGHNERLAARRAESVAWILRGYHVSTSTTSLHTLGERWDLRTDEVEDARGRAVIVVIFRRQSIRPNIPHDWWVLPPRDEDVQRAAERLVQRAVPPGGRPPRTFGNNVTDAEMAYIEDLEGYVKCLTAILVAQVPILPDLEGRFPNGSPAYTPRQLPGARRAIREWLALGRDFPSQVTREQEHMRTRLRGWLTRNLRQLYQGEEDALRAYPHRER